MLRCSAPICNALPIGNPPVRKRTALPLPIPEPGEEGVQDMKLVVALYESGRTGKAVSLAPLTTVDALRGTPPDEA